MRRYSVLPSVLLLCSCSDGPLEQPQKTNPDDVVVYEDASEAVPTPSPAAGDPQPQFECVAGAPDVTATMASEAADRADDDGQQMTVRVFAPPEGSKVFGFPVTVFEKYTRADGSSGIAAYVSPPPATVLQAILARFPGTASNDGIRVTGPGLAGTIQLQIASLGSGDVTRIQCAPTG